MIKEKVLPMVIQHKKLLTLTGIVAAACILGACYGTKSHRAYNLDALNEKQNIVPIVIIGSGPAGLSAGIYGARANRQTLIIEGNEPGGLLTKTTTVENWPGEVSIQGPEIVKKMRDHAVHLGVSFLADSVENVDLTQWPFVITTGDGVEIHALTLIIATGANPRKLNIPGEDLSGVSSCAVCDAPFFKNEEVAVVGGGDSAVEEAIQLATFAKSVTIFVRGSQMRAAASMQDRLKDYANISVLYNVQPKEVLGDGEKVTGVLLVDSKDKSEREFPVNGVFLAVGHIPSSALFKGKIDLDANGYIMLQGRSQETSVEGVFAAGDVEDHIYRQARVAEGSGVKAALDAEGFLQKIGFTTSIGKELIDNTFKVGIKRGGISAVVLESLDEFNALIEQSEGLVVLDFYADYCPSCLHMLPAFESLASEYEGTVTFAKVDAEKATDLVTKFYVTKVPCLLVFSEGKLVGRYNQMMDKKELREFVDQFLK
jgi:thioredoxin reductase (NADPH)